MSKASRKNNGKQITKILVSISIVAYAIAGVVGANIVYIAVAEEFFAFADALYNRLSILFFLLAVGFVAAIMSYYRVKVQDRWRILVLCAAFVASLAVCIFFAYASSYYHDHKPVLVVVAIWVITAVLVGWGCRRYGRGR